MGVCVTWIIVPQPDGVESTLSQDAYAKLALIIPASILRHWSVQLSVVSASLPGPDPALTTYVFTPI